MLLIRNATELLLQNLLTFPHYSFRTGIHLVMVCCITFLQEKIIFMQIIKNWNFAWPGKHKIRLGAFLSGPVLYFLSRWQLTQWGTRFVRDLSFTWNAHPSRKTNDKFTSWSRQNHSCENERIWEWLSLGLLHRLVLNLDQMLKGQCFMSESCPDLFREFHFLSYIG